MGMELTVTFGKSTPSFEAILTRWKHAGIPIAIRMIDGLPAFPDEIPGDEWNEIRVSTSAGMLTLRRAKDRIMLTVWGNADAELIRHWKISAWACAAAGEGRIATGNGEETPEEYLLSERLFQA